jgi:membrane protein
MRRRLRAVLDLFVQAAKDWDADDASRLAASLAFYAAISIAPLLLVVIAVAGFVFGEDAARGAISDQLGGILGNDGAPTVESMVEGAAKPRSGLLATVVGLGILLFGATGVFGELQSSMNAIWDVPPRPGAGVVDFLRRRFVSLSMVFGVAFLLMVSLVLSAALSALGSVVGWVPGAPLLWRLMGEGISFVIVTALFAMIFKVLPDTTIRFRDVWLGAVVTTALFMLGKFGVGMYLSHADVASSYGAAGSVVVMLLWVYYSAQIFFYGAEFTQAHARSHGSMPAPKAAGPAPKAAGPRPASPG